MTANDDGEVALAAMRVHLKMYECLWQSDNPMRPAPDVHEHQPAQIEFLGKFCDKFPDLAEPGWKQLVRHLRGDVKLEVECTS